MCMLSPKAYANYVQFEKELEGFKAFDKGNKTTRLNPIIRYQEKCWSYFYEFAKPLVRKKNWWRCTEKCQEKKDLMDLLF